LSHPAACVARIIEFDLSGTVGASGAHVTTIVLARAGGYGTKRLICRSLAIDFFDASAIARKSTILHLDLRDAWISY
jgi:hypothetical protein